MDIQKEKIKQEFWNWAKVENPRMVENAELGDVYAIQNLDHMFMGFAAAKSQAVPEGFVLMPMVPSQRMVNAVRGCYEGEAYLPYSLYSEFVNQAMIEAQEQSHEH